MDVDDDDEIYQYSRLDLLVNAVAYFNHLSGLNRLRKKWLSPLRIFKPILIQAIQQAQKEKRGVIFKRAESYVKEYRDAEREKIRLIRLSKQEGNYYVEEEPRLAFVIRIKG